RVPTLVKQAGVFAFVCFAWIFFRAQSLNDAWIIIRRMFSSGLADPRFPLAMLILVSAVWIYQLLYTSTSPMKRVLDLAPVRIGLMILIVTYLALIAQPSTKAFIYLQF